MSAEGIPGDLSGYSYASDGRSEGCKKIREGRRDILLVFVTAFLDYAIEGYRMEAIRFLLKDMLEELLPECMEAVIKKLDLQTYKINKPHMY